MHPFINIHTHCQATSENDVIQIRSIDPVLNPFFSMDTFFSAGVHPWSVHHQHVDWFVYLVQKIAKHEHCVAIGECGLDYHRSKATEIQTDVFIRHFEIAETHQLPLIIHCVKAFHDLLRLKKELKPESPWIIHGFSKSVETARQCIDAGCFLSLGKKVFDPGFANVLLMVPDDMIFFETDDDDVDIREVYRAYAGLRNYKIEDVAAKIDLNFKRCFKKIQ